MTLNVDGFMKVRIMGPKLLRMEDYLTEHQHEYFIWQYGSGGVAYIHRSLPIYVRESTSKSVQTTNPTTTMPDFIPNVFYLLYCGVTNRALMNEVSFLQEAPDLNNHRCYAFTPMQMNIWYTRSEIIELFSTRFLSKHNTANSCLQQGGFPERHCKDKTGGVVRKELVHLDHTGIGCNPVCC